MSVAQLTSAQSLGAAVETSLVLVSDRFAGIAGDNRVHTVSGLAAALRGGAYRAHTGDLTVHLGQGVTRHALDYIQHVATIHAPGTQLRVVGAIAEPARRHHVHKYQDSNVLLANLVRETDTAFRADLRIDGDNELLHDHQTGEHVQGIVIIEAVRQLFLAAFELEYGKRWPEQHFYIVWNSIDLTYGSFLFPLPATLHAELTPLSIDDPAKLEFAIDTEVRQFGKSAASSRITFAALPNERIAQIERHKAAKAVTAYLGGAA
ncbi:AfsA-related hotdog domain-containing protein [Nocardia xishanensis]